MPVDLKEVLKLLRTEHVEGERVCGRLLEEAVTLFPSNQRAASGAIRQLQVSDPTAFAIAAVRLLATTEDPPPGMKYVADLMVSGDLLLDLLLDCGALETQPALALARILASAEPQLDVRLIRKMQANARGEMCKVEPQVAVRVLKVVTAISDCTRLSSYLIQLLRHPSPNVRSQAALLIGRANLNVDRVRGLMGSDDPRLRANTVESLWGQSGANVKTILKEAAADKHGRVALNALVGLYLCGERQVCRRIAELASSSDPVIRAGAAWAMGETGDAQFDEVLTKLEQDPDEKVRAMATRSRAKVTPSEPVEAGTSPG
jgi:hypothetical protein